MARTREAVAPPDRVKIATRIPESLRRKLKTHVSRTGVTVESFLERLIEKSVGHERIDEPVGAAR